VSSQLWNLWPDIIFCLNVPVLSLWGALSDERSVVSCQSLSAVFSPLSKFNLIYMLQSHVFYVCTIYTRPLSAQAQYSRSWPIICSLCYNSSLDTLTVICLTAAKFKLLIFSVLGFKWLFYCCIHVLPWKCVQIVAQQWTSAEYHSCGKFQQFQTCIFYRLNTGLYGQRIIICAFRKSNLDSLSI
jgi:hypothetical protein